MKNIVLFGDSLFGRLKQRHLLKMEDVIKGTLVHGCAIGGLDTRQGVKRASLIAKLNADYTCLSFGANDCSPSKGKPVSIDEFRKNYSAIIDAFSGTHIVIFPCPPAYDLQDEQGTKEFNDILAEYNAVIKELSSEKGVSCIDSEKIYSELLTKGIIYHEEDGLHLNDFGYDVLFAEFAKIIV